MVELSTFLEKTPPDKKLEPISNDDLLVVEVSVGVWMMLGMEEGMLEDWWRDGSYWPASASGDIQELKGQL